MPGARVVKAFNHLRAEVLAGDPRADGGRRVLFYSGNDNAAKAEVAALIDRIDFVGIDLGSLAVGGKLAQFPGGPLPNQISSRSAERPPGHASSARLGPQTSVPRTDVVEMLAEERLRRKRPPSRNRSKKSKSELSLVGSQHVEHAV